MEMSKKPNFGGTLGNSPKDPATLQRRVSRLHPEKSENEKPVVNAGKKVGRNQETVKASVMLPIELHTEIKIRCAKDRGTTVGGFILEAVGEKLGWEG